MLTSGAQTALALRQVVSSPAHRLAVRTRTCRAYKRRRQVTLAMGVEKITIGSIPAYEVGEKSAPAVIVLQEWWGVTDDLKEIAVDISKRSYRALIPDLYKGKVGVEVEEAKHIREGLDWDQAIKELYQTVEYLRSTGSRKVGCMGFCMGGALTLAMSQSGKIDCGAPCYGLPSEGHGEAEKMKIPLQGHFGRQDTFFPVKDAEAFAKKCNDSGGNFELFVYDDAGHAFLTAEDHREKLDQPLSSDETRKLAWSRIYKFFDKHLK